MLDILATLPVPIGAAGNGLNLYDPIWWWDVAATLTVTVLWHRLRPKHPATPALP